MSRLLLALSLALTLSIGMARPTQAAGTPSPQADCNGRFVTTFVTLLGGQGFGQVVAGLTQSEHPLGATDVSLTATGAVPCPVP
jgi:hypothetical protein